MKSKKSNEKLNPFLISEDTQRALANSKIPARLPKEASRWHEGFWALPEESRKAFINNKMPSF